MFTQSEKSRNTTSKSERNSSPACSHVHAYKHETAHVSVVFAAGLGIEVSGGNPCLGNHCSAGCTKGHCNSPRAGQPKCQSEWWSLDLCKKACDFEHRHCANRSGCSLDEGYCLGVPSGMPLCQPGWWHPATCDRACDFAHRHCANRSGCSLDEGYCLGVPSGMPLCQPGWWHPATCDRACDFAHRHCANRSGCSLDEGYCLGVVSGMPLCQPGWWHPATCDRACPGRCAENNCSLAIGACRCKDGWTGQTCSVPAGSSDKLKELAERFQELVFDRLKEKLPRVFRCIYDAVSFIESFNEGLDSMKQTVASTADATEKTYKEIKYAHDVAASFMDSFKDCSGGGAALQRGLAKVGSAVDRMETVAKMAWQEFSDKWAKLSPVSKAAWTAAGAAFLALAALPLEPAVAVASLASAMAEALEATAGLPPLALASTKRPELLHV